MGSPKNQPEVEQAPGAKGLRFPPRLPNLNTDQPLLTLATWTELTDVEFVYGFGNSTLCAAAEPNADVRCAVKSSLAGSFDQRAKHPPDLIWLRREARPSGVYRNLLLALRKCSGEWSMSNRTASNFLPGAF